MPTMAIRCHTGAVSPWPSMKSSAAEMDRGVGEKPLAGRMLSLSLQSHEFMTLYQIGPVRALPGTRRCAGALSPL